MYCNVTRESIMEFLKLCIVCQKKSSNKKRGLVSKPILHSAYNSRAQLDLIDMQSQEHNGFRFIMVYQDHLTKFVNLRPLKSKRAEEISLNLMKIYTLFGAPAILHSDNGREFVNSVITELHKMWSEVKIVHGKPRHSQSQGSVERANRDIEEILSAWMEENHSKDWPNALDIVQFRKNRSFHAGIGRSPFEAMFGCSAQVGLLSIGIPHSEINNINTEEDIDRICKENAENQNKTSVTQPAATIESNLELPNIEICNDANNEIFNNTISIDLEATKNTETLISRQDATVELFKPDNPITKRFRDISTNRENARECLGRQAKKMLKLSEQSQPPIAIGSMVRLPIPDVDRARGAPRNILAAVINIDNDYYTLGNEHGTLNKKYVRSEFFKCAGKLINVENVSAKKVSLREAASQNSVFGAQGYELCNCKTGCAQNKCKCFKSNKKCNSKCHSSLSCKNK
ncbi:KRAB-A domain-containing protein 2-like [Leptopilina heterotoma]|uniref:KRAB-A domain-containing protein 2-like n=1 Tax=Leptopilina heterotoma TaxID=63436 RepID=UPI001CA7FB0A|nr:KRAB-A domain-containing protein 2-like [Leptopilina heterotoma]